MDISTLFVFAMIIFAVVLLFQTVRIVPQQEAWILERLGKYNRTLNAGLHIVVPFIEVIRYRHSLKEIVLDIPAQVCITKDNVSVSVDGVLFFRVMDPVNASYGISYYDQAVIQLAQTTLRSEIGKIDLDRTFEERENINNAVISAIDKATDPWGVKVLRYEIKTIQPPKDIVDAMEKQMRAEREKRAKVLESESDRDARINRAEGNKQEAIKESEGEKTRQINQAEGQAAAILSVASASADALNQIAKAINQGGGMDAARLKLAEEYVKQLGQIALTSKAVIVPANMNDMSGMLTSALTVMDTIKSTKIDSPKS